MFTKLVLSLALLLPFLALAAAADEPAAPSAPVYEMVFKNGDRLTGTVLKREKGKITFHSEVAGDLVVEATQVTLTEKPTKEAPASRLASAPPPAARPPSPPPAAAAPAQPAIGWWWPWWVRRPFATLEPIVNRWTGKVEFGYGNQLTNIRTVTTDLRIQAERNVGPDDFQVKDTYLYGSSSGVPSTDQSEFDFQWRHNLDERLFYQMLTTYGWDKVRLINDQIEQTADLGYKFLATHTQTLNIGAGIMGQYLNATGISERANYLGHVFEDYTYKISGRYTFTENASAQYSPQREARFGVLLPNLGTAVSPEALNYSYNFHATLQGKMTDHLSLNLHFDYSYDNSVLTQENRADQQITSTLGYSF